MWQLPIYRHLQQRQRTWTMDHHIPGTVGCTNIVVTMATTIPEIPSRRHRWECRACGACETSVWTSHRRRSRSGLGAMRIGFCVKTRKELACAGGGRRWGRRQTAIRCMIAACGARGDNAVASMTVSIAATRGGQFDCVTGARGIQRSCVGSARRRRPERKPAGARIDGSPTQGPIDATDAAEETKVGRMSAANNAGLPKAPARAR